MLGRKRARSKVLAALRLFDDYKLCFLMKKMYVIVLIANLHKFKTHTGLVHSQIYNKSYLSRYLIF